MGKEREVVNRDESAKGMAAAFLEPLEGFRLGFISLLAALIGILAGLIAYVLYDLIGLFTNLAYYHEWSFHFRSPENTHLGLWIIVTPVTGGLIVGLMAKYGSEKIKGHGIPEAMEAVLTSRSRIEAKVAILKPLSAAIAIGTGGPFGAEGPIIQTGGAFGSLVGQFISTTAAERKVLLACGAGAGMITGLACEPTNRGEIWMVKSTRTGKLKVAVRIAPVSALLALCFHLSARGDELEPIRNKFPTGALATLAFEGPWRDLGPGAAALTAYVRPKDLH